MELMLFLLNSTRKQMIKFVNVIFIIFLLINIEQHLNKRYFTVILTVFNTVNENKSVIKN